MTLAFKGPAQAPEGGTQKGVLDPVIELLFKVAGCLDAVRCTVY